MNNKKRRNYDKFSKVKVMVLTILWEYVLLWKWILQLYQHYLMDDFAHQHQLPIYANALLLFDLQDHMQP